MQIKSEASRGTNATGDEIVSNPMFDLFPAFDCSKHMLDMCV